MNKDQQYRKAFALIEQWRYRFDIDSTVKLFISHWAYLHTGAYKVENKIIETAEYQDVAKPLSHILSNLMLNGVSDPLATILSEFCKGDSKHQGYYPTPPEIGTLISELLGTDTANNLYEPACGSAGIIMQKIEGICLSQSYMDNPLEDVSVTVEDINPVCIHAFVIQFIHKLQYLSILSGTNVKPKSLIASQVDVISRKSGAVQYYFEG